MRSMAPQPRFYGGLNGLRGIACIIVLLSHCLLAFRFYGLQTTTGMTGFRNDMLHLAITVFNGPACVTLFFILSGVVLSLSLDVEMAMNKKIVLSYWIKRASRLYPLLILSTVLAMMMQFFVYRHIQFRAVTPGLNNFYRVHLTLKELLRSAAGVSANLNGPAWSIKVEIVESAFFPIIFLLSRKSAATAILTAFVLLTMTVTAHGNGTTLDDLRTFTLCFFIGAIIPRWSRSVATLLPSSVQSLTILGSVIVFCTAQWMKQPFGNLLEVLSSTYIIIVAYHRPSRFLEKSIIMRKLGEISYSIYLLHLPALMAIVYVWMTVLRDPLNVDWFYGTVLLAVFTIAVAVPISYLSYMYFERPIERAGRRAAKRITSAHIETLKAVGQV